MNWGQPGAKISLLGLVVAIVGVGLQFSLPPTSDYILVGPVLLLIGVIVGTIGAYKANKAAYDP
jgi:hypothetical protein